VTLQVIIETVITYFHAIDKHKICYFLTETDMILHFLVQNVAIFPYNLLIIYLHTYLCHYFSARLATPQYDVKSLYFFLT